MCAFIFTDKLFVPWCYFVREGHKSSWFLIPDIIEVATSHSAIQSTWDCNFLIVWSPATRSVSESEVTQELKHSFLANHHSLELVGESSEPNHQNLNGICMN